ANLVDLLQVVGQLDAVDDDAAGLVLLEPVDAADHGGLARARGPGDDDALAAVDAQVDVAQHVKIAVPLVHGDDLDGDIRVQPTRLRRRCRSGIGHGVTSPFVASG